MLHTDLILSILKLMWITLMLLNKTADSAQTNSIVQPNAVITAHVGEDVILHCFRLGEQHTESIVWYKQKVGHKPCVMVTVQHKPDYEEEFKPPKFSIEKEIKDNKKTNCHLKIAKVDTSDEAVYYCGFRDFLTRFGNGTFLAVKDNRDVNVSVSQSGGWDSVPAGASVNLQCLVASESRAADLQVFWFRAVPPQSDPEIIYTHHDSSHQCERFTSTHSCVYNFSTNILSLSDTGTYYCAVAVCGKIILGNGTLVQMERTVDPKVIILAASLGASVVVIFALIFVLTSKDKGQEQSRMRLRKGSVTDRSISQDEETVEVNYAALHFNEKGVKRGRGKKQQSQETIYSGVRRSVI